MKNIKVVKFLLLIFVVFSVAIFLLFVSERWITDNLGKNLLTAIAISLLTTDTFAIVSALMQKNNIEDVLCNSFKIITKCYDYGLIDISSAFPLSNEMFVNDFLNSKRIAIVMNDGKSFISTNSKLIKKRVATPGLKTELIIQDYTHNDIMSLLTRKNGHQGNYYHDKIKEFVERDINMLGIDENHKFDIYFNHNYNTMAIILMDNYAMVSLYRISPGKTTVPHFVFRKGHDEYDEITMDVDNLKTGCRQK